EPGGEGGSDEPGAGGSAAGGKKGGSGAGGSYRGGAGGDQPGAGGSSAAPDAATGEGGTPGEGGSTAGAGGQPADAAVTPGATDSDHCRITRSRFQLGVARAGGTSQWTRIDHNEFGPKNTGDGHYVHATNMSENTRMDHNYLHDATGGGTSRDAASLGCCGPEFDYHETGNVFEFNLLVNCSADAEYISIKSSKNTIRYNTFRKNGGTLTLRAGRNSQLYGNFFFGVRGIRP